MLYRHHLDVGKKFFELDIILGYFGSGLQAAALKMAETRLLYGPRMAANYRPL